MRLLHVLFIASIFTFCATYSNVITSTCSAFEKPLKTEKADLSEVRGTYTLILYGGRFLDDLETVAFLDFEGDEYRFEPFAPDFDYRIKKGIQVKEALAEAQKFISFHNAFWHAQQSRILDSKGNIIGYELRPLYLPFVYGISDLMDINYWPREGGKVKVTIKLIPMIEKLKFPGGGDGGSGGGGGGG
jgi:hypothetical protein